MHAIEVNGKNDSQSSNDLRTRTLNSIYSCHAPFSHCFYYYLNDLCRCLLLYVALLLFCSVRVVVLCLEFIHFHYVDVVFLCVCACTSKQIILCKTLFVTLVLTITHKYSWKMCTRTKHREHEMNKEAHNTQTHTHTLSYASATVKSASITCNALRQSGQYFSRRERERGSESEGKDGMKKERRENQKTGINKSSTTTLKRKYDPRNDFYWSCFTYQTQSSIYDTHSFSNSQYASQMDIECAVRHNKKHWGRARETGRLAIDLIYIWPSNWRTDSEIDFYVCRFLHDTLDWLHLIIVMINVLFEAIWHNRKIYRLNALEGCVIFFFGAADNQMVVDV